MHEHMGLVEARELVADERFADAEQQRIARTIVAQAEQIKRLQAAVREADEAHWWALADRYIGPDGHAYKPDFVATYNLLPGDMEDTDE